LRAFTSALAITSQDESALRGLALSRAAQGDLAGAIEAWRNLLAKAPNDEEACFQLGLLSHRQGSYGEAAQAFQQCLDLRPDWREACLNLGLCLWQAGDAAKFAFEVYDLDAGTGERLRIKSRKRFVIKPDAPIIRAQASQSELLPFAAAQFCDRSRFHVHHIRIDHGAFDCDAVALRRRHPWTWRASNLTTPRSFAE
jgi:tetratricopeptide (TPR) repeat protein